MKYRDEFGRSAFFARSIENVRGDIEYMNAIAKKHATQIRTIKAGQDMIEKEQKLDDEIEKLKKEMNKLEDDKQGGGTE